MAQVLQSPSHFPSSSTSSTPCGHPSPHISSPTMEEEMEVEMEHHLGTDNVEEEEEERERKKKERDREGDQLSILTLLVVAFRKSLIGCSSSSSRSDGGGGELSSMEIGLPSNVRHVAHVTFDRFNGFLGLPVEFEPEVPRRVPSARSVSFHVHFFNVLCMRNMIFFHMFFTLTFFLLM